MRVRKKYICIFSSTLFLGVAFAFALQRSKEGRSVAFSFLWYDTIVLHDVEVNMTWMTGGTGGVGW